MSDIWYIDAELEHVNDKRIVLYIMEEAQEYARPNLGDILLWCRDACEHLLKDLREKKADERDLQYVEREIQFLRKIEEAWRIEHREW